MTVRIACTHCNSELSMPETMYGKPVRCPKCQQIFTCPSGPEAQASPPEPRPARSGGANPFEFEAPAAPPSTSSPEEAEDRGDESSRRPARTGWSRVTSGGLMLAISGIVFLSYIGIGYLLMTSTMAPSDKLQFMAILSCVVPVAGNVLGAIGLYFCTAVPHSSGAKGPAFFGAIALLIASIGSIVTNGASLIIRPESPPSPTFAKILGWMYLLMIGGMLAGVVLTTFYMTITAMHVRARLVLTSIVTHVTLTAVAPIVLALSTGVLAMIVGGGRGSREDITLLGNLLLLFVVIGAILWFVANVFMLNGAINQARRKGTI